MDYAQQAQVLAQGGDLRGAQQAIRRAISLREDGPDFQQIAGMIALQAGDLPGAYGAFTRALESDATNRLALAYVANLGVQVGRVREAEEAANRLLTLEPDALPALQVKGMIAISRGDLEEASGYADRLLARNSVDEAGSIIKARVLARQGQAEEAVSLIDNALRAVPSSAALLVNKVHLHRFLAQPEPMAAALEKFVSVGGAPVSIKLNQINLLYKLGRAQQAREAALVFLREGVENPADYRTLQRIWWQYDASPLEEGGARNSSDWKDPLAVVATARYLLARGQREAARELLSSAPPEAGGLVRSLLLRSAADRGDRVASQVDALLKDDAENVDALLLKAEIALQKGDRRVALEAAQLALANDPLNADAYITLAGLYRLEGGDWRAKQIFEEGLKKLPQDFQLVQAYTQYLHELGDKTRAISVARSFARALPSSDLAWSMFLNQCRQAQDAACGRMAESGLEQARTAYDVDDPPGARVDRGLFGRI